MKIVVTIGAQTLVIRYFQGDQEAAATDRLKGGGELINQNCEG
jgi:hypothetical protein